MAPKSIIVMIGIKIPNERRVKIIISGTIVENGFCIRFSNFILNP